MRICISHKTHYRYERPVKALTQILRLTPRGHDGQHVRKWRIEPSVDGLLRPREDPFGNIVHVFSAEGAVEEMTICVTGEVETHDTAGVIRGTVERLPDPVYLRDSDLTMADDGIQEFAHSLAGGVSDPLQRLHRLLEGVNGQVAFDTTPTQVTTTAAESFALKRGVARI